MKFETAKGFYEYGKYLKRIGKLAESKRELESAYQIFREINAQKYEKTVANMLGIMSEGGSTSERFTKELKNNQRMSSILELTQDISSTLDLDALLEKLVSIALQVTGAQRGFLLVRDDSDSEIKVLSKKNVDGKSGEDTYSRNIVEDVLESGKAIFTTNAMEDNRFSGFHSVVHHQLKSVLCVPIKYNGEVNSVCYLDNPLLSSVFTEEDMEVLNTIMVQAAISIENAKLYREAITDGLTGLNVHKHFMSLLQKEIERAKRYKQNVSLIIFDIDHFKKFNDSYGHQAGDAVLKNIAKTAKKAVRDVDILGRYGGEEFGVVLPETDSAEAVAAAERIRKAIENSVVLFSNIKLKVTVSLGVACYPDNAGEVNALIKAADDAMYVSKDGGRNTVSLAIQIDK